LKLSSLFLFSTATVFAVAVVAQNPQTATSNQPAVAAPSAAAQEHVRPAPINLKVLPKNLTGEQVHAIMEEWEAALGVRCNACHSPDPNNIGPNGRPRLNYADDSKTEKSIARKMFTMTEEINRNYLSKIDSSGAPVTCGTCHRGHLGPEPFAIPPDEHDHDHEGPRPAQGPPPAGTVLPAPACLATLVSGLFRCSSA